MNVPSPRPSRGWTADEVKAWLMAVDPRLVAAAAEVDRSLLRDTLALSPAERLRRGSATARWVDRFRRDVSQRS